MIVCKNNDNEKLNYSITLYNNCTLLQLLLHITDTNKVLCTVKAEAVEVVPTSMNH